MGVVHDLRRAAAWLPRLRMRQCVLCGSRVGRFLPYRGGARASPRLVRARGVVGGDIDNFECPRCGGHDRERHLLLYLRASGLLARLAAMRILHFAPERRLSGLIAAAGPVEYIACDLHPAAADVRQADIEDMPFADGTFDLLIANHVLEHVADDLRALREIRRVLVPGGFAILQTPYAPGLHRTWSDPGIRTAEARMQAYGQEDHVRLFGRDIFDRFASCGMQSRAERHSVLLAGVDARSHGVNEGEPFFLFQKPAAPEGVS